MFKAPNNTGNLIFLVVVIDFGIKTSGCGKFIYLL